MPKTRTPSGQTNGLSAPDTTPTPPNHSPNASNRGNGGSLPAGIGALIVGTILVVASLAVLVVVGIQCGNRKLQVFVLDVYKELIDNIHYLMGK